MSKREQATVACTAPNDHLLRKRVSVFETSLSWPLLHLNLFKY